MSHNAVIETQLNRIKSTVPLHNSVQVVLLDSSFLEQYHIRTAELNQMDKYMYLIFY